MLGWLRSLAFVVVLASPLVAQPVPVGQLLPVAVHSGRCELVLPTERPDDKYFLILGSLSRHAGPYPVTIQTQNSQAAAALSLEQSSVSAEWTNHIRAMQNRLIKGRPVSAVSYQSAAEPPRQKIFHLFTRESDFQNPESYLAVVGELQAVGLRCQVYVDRAHGNIAELRPAIDDVIRTFDEEICPRTQDTAGAALDVDRDGRFTILFTGWLGRLVDGKVRLGGFVRGSDFQRDLPAPYSNHCDMMYLNTDLQAGPHLRSLVAHEYTHAVVFSEHVFGDYIPGAPRQDEESWLNEGLAHLAEDRAGYSWSNLDYRISAFLSAPERYQLVVPDYYRAGLWRSHGNRGATYLFLRWCSDRFGDDFARRLIQTNLCGVENVEVATQTRFADLFRQWSAAVVLSGSHIGAAGLTPIQRIDLRRPLEGRRLSGPRFEEVPLAGGKTEIALAGTAFLPVLLHSPSPASSRIEVQAPAEADLQVTLIRLPPQTGRLHAKLVKEDTRLRLAVTAYDSDVHLDGAVWEVLVPTNNRPEDTSYRAGQGKGALFEQFNLSAGQSCQSRSVELPESVGNQTIVFKVAATDAAGHCVGAWAGTSADERR